MRLTPRLAVGITLLALVAGCGRAGSASVREVPGGPVELEVPGTAEGFGPAATPTADRGRHGDPGGRRRGHADA